MLVTTSNASIHFIVGIWVVTLIVVYLIYRQLKTCYRNNTIPANFRGIYDENTFNKARVYCVSASKFSLFCNFYYAVVMTIILLFDGLAWFWSVSETLVSGPQCGIYCDELIIHGLFFWTVGVTLYTIWKIPLSIYQTFVLEEKFGLNKQTGDFFFKNTIKSYVVMLASGVLFVAVFIYIWKKSGNYYFIYIWVINFVVALAINAVIPDFLTRAFFKCTHLPEGELRTKIEELANDQDFPSNRIYVMKVSHTTTRVNAYFTGIYRNKRIMLFDTLLENKELPEEGNRNLRFTVDELLAILSHELGHWKHNHVLQTLLYRQLGLAILFTFWYFADVEGFILDLLVVGPQPIARCIFPAILCSFSLTQGYSQSFEFQADKFAKTLGRAEHLKSSLIKIDLINLVFPIFDRCYAKIVLSHAPLLERLKALDEKTENKEDETNV